MRKTFNLSALLMLLVFTLTGFSSAKAQTPIEFGKTYSAPAYQYFNGAITISSPGTLKVQVIGTEGTLYTPSDTEKDWDGQAYLDNGGQEFTYNLTATGTYNYIVPMPWDDSTYVFSFDGQGGSTGGGGTTENVLPVPTTNFTLSQNMYTYTPSESGILTIVYQQAPYDNCLYGAWVNGHGDDRVALQDGIDPNTGATTFSWAVEGGHKYYLASDYPANNVVTTSFVAGGGNTPGGDDIDGYAPVQLNKDYEIADGETLAVYFTAPSNGTLTISQWGTDDPFLFLVPSKNTEDYSNMAPSEGYMGSDPCVFTYLVEKGTTYYFYGVHDSAAYKDLNKVSFAFEVTSGGGSENPNQPGEMPEGYQAMEMKSYAVNGVGAVKLVFTPNTSGTLIVTQTGDFDSHLYNVVPAYDATYGYGITTPLQTQGDGGYSGENPYTLKYGVAAGVTYYYVGKTNTYDGLSAVSFEFEAVNNNNTIVLDTPYVVNYQSPVYTFTPKETGILTVTWTNPIPGGEPALGTTFYQGSNQFFLYSDYGLSNAMPMLAHEEIENVGCKVTFNVVAGEHYYLKLDALANWQCVFTMEAGELQAAAIKEIEPVPGTAYDTVNFQYYWNLILAPNAPSLDKVTLTYVPANDPNGNSTTIELSTQTIDGGVFPPYEFGGDAMRISAVELNRLLSAGEIANETDIVFTIYGLKAAGEYVTENLMVQGDDYVTIGENGLVTVTFKCGTPIALLNASFPSPFRRAWERGDKAGMATLTYDKEVYYVGAVTVTQGHQYYGSEGGGDNPPYSVTVPAQNVTWQGNSVNIDFTGINYNMPSGTNEVTIMVSGPVGQNGLSANYDGIPVLQHYVSFTTEGSAEIDEPIINTIEPFDGATFGGLVEDETILIDLLDGIRETAYNVEGVLTDIEGNEYGTYEFFDIPGAKWLYEITDDVVFYEDMTYLFTVTAWNEEGIKLGSQIVYWYGNTPRGDQPEPDDIWYVRCNANNFNPNGDAQWALLPSDNEEENGIYTGTVTMTEDFQFNLLNPYGMVYVPMNLETYEPENMTVVFEDNAYYANTDMAYDESEEAYVWTVAGYAGVELTITLDLNDAYITLTIPDGSGVQINLADGSAVYFDLQGRKIANPDKGIYIKVQDGKAIKVVK